MNLCEFYFGKVFIEIFVYACMKNVWVTREMGFLEVVGGRSLSLVGGRIQTISLSIFRLARHGGIYE
jgi:hypothetical protein